MEGIGLLEAYSKQIIDVDAFIRRRDAAVNEFDYYRGKNEKTIGRKDENKYHAKVQEVGKIYHQVG